MPVSPVTAFWIAISIGILGFLVAVFAVYVALRWLFQAKEQDPMTYSIEQLHKKVDYLLSHHRGDLRADEESLKYTKRRAKKK